MVGLVLRRALMWVRIHAGVPPLGAVPFAWERRAAPRRRRRRRSHRRGDSLRRARALPKPGTLVASLPGQKPLVAAGRIVRGTAPADGPRAEAREQRRRRRPSGAGAARAGAGRPTPSGPAPPNADARGCAPAPWPPREPRTPPPWIASPPPWPPWWWRPGTWPGTAGRALDAAEAAGAVVARVGGFRDRRRRRGRPNRGAREMPSYPFAPPNASPEPFWGVERRG